MNEAELDQLLDAWEAPAPPPSLRRGLVAMLDTPHRSAWRVPRRWALAIAGVALCAAMGAANFRTSRLGDFYKHWDSDIGSGLYVHVSRRVDPPLPAYEGWSLGGGHWIGGSGSTLRGGAYLRDRRAGTYSGYEYTLEQVVSGQFRISFSPLQLSQLKNRVGPFRIDGQLVNSASIPAPQTVQAGEPFEATLRESGSERIYDRIELSWTALPDWPRTLHPAAQQGSMRLAGAQIYINGRLAASQRNAGAGPVIWVHLPGQGRFLVALDAQGNTRFTQAGHVGGNVMEFQSGGTQFRIVCTEPIVTGGDHVVFVYHQQSFENVLDPLHPLAGQAFLGNAGPASLHVE